MGTFISISMDHSVHFFERSILFSWKKVFKCDTDGQINIMLNQDFGPVLTPSPVNELTFQHLKQCCVTVIILPGMF